MNHSQKATEPQIIHIQKHREAWAQRTEKNPCGWHCWLTQLPSLPASVRDVSIGHVQPPLYLGTAMWQSPGRWSKKGSLLGSSHDTSCHLKEMENTGTTFPDFFFLWLQMQCPGLQEPSWSHEGKTMKNTEMLIRTLVGYCPSPWTTYFYTSRCLTIKYCYGLNYVLTKFICWSPNFQYLRL